MAFDQDAWEAAGWGGIKALMDKRICPDHADVPHECGFNKTSGCVCHPGRIGPCPFAPSYIPPCLIRTVCLCPACGRGNAPTTPTCLCKGYPPLVATC